jgi:1,4-dihydroxy-6-naphthoate synthase
MKLTLGFSPCPNDTFIFDAMLHGKIDTEGLDFEIVMEDVEALNQRAFRGELQVTKLSYHAFAYCLEHYILLDAGSALGNNCGPLLIAKSNTIPLTATTLIAIPGNYTTANFLLSLAFPQLKNKQTFLFSAIETAILEDKVAAGLIIHENRFTYQQKGLEKIIDCGEYWETLTGLPIPLGGIVIQRHLPAELQQKVNRVLRRSVQFALANPSQTLDFVRPHAQEMSEAVMLQHIGLYVNRYTVELGDVGRQAVQHLFDKARALELVPHHEQAIFLPKQQTK